MKITAKIQSFLDKPYLLTKEQTDFYHQYRYIKLKEVLNAETLSFFNEVITERVNQLNTTALPLQDRSTYGKAFLQLFNLWLEDKMVKELISVSVWQGSLLN